MRVKLTNCDACEKYSASIIDTILKMYLCRSCYSSFNINIEDTNEYQEDYQFNNELFV
jgi:hypothetical protein